MYAPQHALPLRLTFKEKEEEQGGEEGGRVSEPLLPCEPVPCTAPVPQSMADVSPLGGGWLVSSWKSRNSPVQQL